MGGIKKFMVVHKDPHISWEKVQGNWAKLANVKEATWVRTYYNKGHGIRYCIWLSPDEDALKDIFSELESTWDSMVEVDETTPDLWGKHWDEHLKAEAKADTLAF